MLCLPLKIKSEADGYLTSRQNLYFQKYIYLPTWWRDLCLLAIRYNPFPVLKTSVFPGGVPNPASTYLMFGVNVLFGEQPKEWLAANTHSASPINSINVRKKTEEKTK